MYPYSPSPGKTKSSQNTEPTGSSSMSLTNWSVDETIKKANGKKENSDEATSSVDDRKKSKKNDTAPILSEDEYFSAFQWCSIPWALARVDGRFCDCNEAFSRVSGFSRNEVLSFTIFNLINPVDLQDTFR
jgi:PAS domain-containing protein